MRLSNRRARELSSAPEIASRLRRGEGQHLQVLRLTSSTNRLSQSETPASPTVLPQDQPPLAPTCASEAQPTAQATTSSLAATMSRAASDESLALRCLVHQVVNTDKTVGQVLHLPRNKRFKGAKGVSRANLYRAVQKKRAELAAAGCGFPLGSDGG